MGVVIRMLARVQIIIVSIGLLVLGGQCVKITEVQTKTTAESGSGTDDAVNFAFFSDLFDECRINRASDPYDGDDREPGDTNVFKGEYLQECATHEFQLYVKAIEINIEGNDLWRWDYFRIFYDDFSYDFCEGGEVDSQQTVQIMCEHHDLPFSKISVI